MAATDPQTLITSAGCYQCLTEQEQLLVLLGLLKQISLALNPSADTSSNGLLDAAKCYNCNGGGGLWKLLELGLLANIAGP